MTFSEAQDRITEIDYELASIQMKSLAIGLASGIGAVFFFGKDKKLLGKVGYFFAGSIVAGIPTNLIFSSKITQLLAEKENIKRQFQIN